MTAPWGVDLPKFKRKWRRKKTAAPTSADIDRQLAAFQRKGIPVHIKGGDD